MSTGVSQLGSGALRHVLDFAPVGVLVENVTGHVIWMNHTLGWQLGVDPEECLGLHTARLPMEPVAGARGKRWFCVCDDGRHEHGPTLECIEDILPEYSSDGIRVRYFLASRQRASGPLKDDLLKLLAKRTSVDACTGLRDQQGISQTLRTEVSRSRRYGNPLSVIVLEVSPRREAGTVINHPSRTMILVSQMLQESTRWADSLGRFEEWSFLLVLPETTAVAAQQLVRKIRHRLECSDVADSVHTHFGVAEWCRGDDDRTLVRRAEQAVAQTVNS